MAILTLLAHQDDEIAMASRIRLETKAGRDVYCCFLTDGAARRRSSTTRNAESLGVLGRLGVPADRVFFLGTEHRIPDGSLFRNLDRAYDLVAHATRFLTLQEILCLSWEGGHPDHDAAHLLALALAQERRLLDHIREFPLYNGSGTWGGFFRVMSPVGRRIEKRRITLAEGLRIAALSFEYRSQRRTWLGLFPEMFVKLVILREEISGIPEPERVRRRPHEGRLLYERRYGVAYGEFQAAVEDFIRRRIG